MTLPSMLPQARVLARSLRACEPEWTLQVALLGDSRSQAHDEEGFQLVSVEQELGIDVQALLEHYRPADLLVLFIPRLLESRCRGDDEPWLHLPASTFIVGSMAPVARAVQQRGVLLAARAAEEPPEDGLEPSREQLRASGRITPSLIGVDCSAQARSFLRWWNERLEAVFGELGAGPRRLDPEDRAWLLRVLELAPARFSAGLLEDPGCNVSVWNLHERTLRETQAGTVVVDGQPLRFMDLDGFQPDHPYRLNETSSRIRVSRISGLRNLLSEYGAQLIKSGWRSNRSRVGIGGRLPNGLVLDETMLSLYASAAEVGQEFGDLSSPPRSELFTEWLRQPVAPWQAEGISRYLIHRVMRERPDVLAAYPDTYGADSGGLAAWWRTSGRHEMQVDELLLPAEEVAQRAPPGGAPRPTPAPRPATRRRDRPRQPPPAAEDGLPVGVRVTGYLGHILGLASAARGYVAALQAVGVPLSTVTVPLDHLQAPVELSPEYGRHSYEDVVGHDGHAFELVCVNADELPHLVERLGEAYFAGPRIAVWGWETTTIPRRWDKAFKLVDEIWVYSSFMAEHIGAAAPVPVTPLPPPVEVPLRRRGPLRLGVPEGFLFLFMFDYLSTIQRKNPVGLIEAFKRAFRPGEGPQLLIKTINAPLRPFAEEEVLWAAEGRPDIHIMDRSLAPEERDALMMSCDCYVSLHRSEGFGLTLAEAMAIGKPVIGTAYSGNTDFMDETNSFLVDYEMTFVGPECEIYPADGEWAEPDLEQAAALMRTVCDQPQTAAGVAARARADIAARFSAPTTGAAMKRRLNELAGEHSPRRRRARRAHA